MFNRSRTILRVSALAGAICAGATLYGCSGGSSDNATTPTKSGSGSDSAGGAPAQAMGGGGGQMGQMMAGMGGGGGGAQSPAGAAQAKDANKLMPPHRPDPFKPTWPPPAPPNVLSFVAPVRIADTGTADKPNQPNIEIHEMPQMRVAGILSGSGIYALLEGGPGDGSVVKPGDMVGDYRVASINQDSIILKKTVKVAMGTQTYTQVVPLSDSGNGAATVAASPGGGAMGQMPGRSGIGLPGARGGTPGGGQGRASE